jgi:hypothetical protein
MSRRHGPIARRPSVMGGVSLRWRATGVHQGRPERQIVQTDDQYNARLPMRAASRDRSVVASALVVLTCLVLGLLAGGMLLIGVSFVSFWKSLSPSDFQAWFASHSHLIGRLMIPLGAGGVVVTVAAVIACWRGPATARRWLLIAAVSVVGVMVTYPVFFASANAAFERGGLTDVAVHALLDRWAAWHWSRTALGTLGFLAALRALQER